MTSKSHTESAQPFADVDVLMLGLAARLGSAGSRVRDTDGAIQLVVHQVDGTRQMRWIELRGGAPLTGSGLAADVRAFLDVDASDCAALLAGRPLVGALRAQGDVDAVRALLTLLASQPRGGSPLATRIGT